MRRLALPLALALILALSAPVSAATSTYKAKMIGPGPTGTVTVSISGSTGTLKWNLSGIAKHSTLVVVVRGGTCADRLGLVVKSTWESPFRDGTSVQTRTLQPEWVTFFKRNWTSRGGDVAIVKNDGHSQCLALVKQ